jgi:hypothetical protein
MKGFAKRIIPMVICLLIAPQNASSRTKKAYVVNLSNGVERYVMALAKGAFCDDANVFWVQDDFHFMIDRRCRSLEWVVSPANTAFSDSMAAATLPAAAPPATVATAPPTSAARPNSEEKQQPAISGIGMVNTQQNSLNIRSGPGKQYNVVGKVARGATVAILEDAGQWLKIRLADGTVGYAAKEHIKP